MYEIATLKSKKLSDLQEIAKTLGVKRMAGLKKLELIYQIIDIAAIKAVAEEKEAGPVISKKLEVNPVKKAAPVKAKDKSEEKKPQKPKNKKVLSLKNKGQSQFKGITITTRTKTILTTPIIITLITTIPIPPTIRITIITKNEKEKRLITIEIIEIVIVSLILNLRELSILRGF